MDFGTIGTALKNIEDVREMFVQYVSVESEALIFPDLGLLKTASQMKNGRGFVVIGGIVSHKVRCHVLHRILSYYVSRVAEARSRTKHV